MKTVNTLFFKLSTPFQVVIYILAMGFLLSPGKLQSQDFIDVSSTIFPASPNNPIPQTGGDIVWGDFDADGDMDFVMTGANGSVSNPYQLIIFRYNSTTGRFERFPGAATLPEVRNSRPAWGDYDSDGDLDLAVVGQDDQGVRFAKIFNFNGFTFQEDLSITPVILSSAVSDGAVSFADYNNDGQLDLLIAGNNGSTSLQLYRHDNLPSNNFLADISLPGVTNPYISWGDYDADGDLDLAYCGTDLANQPPPRFTKTREMETLFPKVLPSQMSRMALSNGETMTMMVIWTCW